MLRAKLTLERLDRDYHVLERREQPSRSFLSKFIALLYCNSAQLLATGPYTMADITNTVRNVDGQVTYSGTVRGKKANFTVGSAPGASGMLFDHGYGVSDPGNQHQGQLVGIQVGTGVNAVTPADYALQTRVAHGRAAGQLEYGGCELVNLAFADPNGTFDIRRYFTNLSGGAITITEVGIYALGAWRGAAVYDFCICRDIVAGGVMVNNTELLRVTYTVQITV